jgi:Spy/CpxP family protein refolding chaperone
MTRTLLRNFGIRTAALTFSGALLFAIPMMAQDSAPQAPPPPPPPAGHMGPGGGGMGARRLEMLTTRLNLTADQQAQVKAIDEDSMKQAQAVRSDTSLSQDDRRAKMMNIRKASDDKIRALLTDDQKTKFDALQAEMKARMQNRDGGAPPPPPPPPQ